MLRSYLSRRVHVRLFNEITKYSKMSTDSFSDVLFEKMNQICLLTLNRPKQLNALNKSMMQQMRRKLDEYEADSSVKAVIVKGTAGGAFCAGGDIKLICQSILNGDKKTPLELYQEEYELVYKIANFKKPYIAFICGVTMGGGVGISVHGKYRIATEKTVFAMPETSTF